MTVPQERPLFQRMLVPSDASPPAERALDLAVALARERNGSIVLCHVVDPAAAVAASSGIAPTEPVLDVVDLLSDEARVELDAAGRRVRDAGVAVETVLRDGNPTDVIVALAEERGVDSIVMGSHGRRGLERLVLGSVAEGVLRRSPVPVLVVPRVR